MPYMVLELMEGDVWDVLQEGPLSEASAHQVFQDLVVAVRHCHSKVWAGRAPIHGVAMHPWLLWGLQCGVGAGGGP